MTERAEILLQRLGLAYRVLLMSTREMGFTQARKYDLEVWSPGVERWLEVSSCSNFRDFQARRMAIRYRPEPGAKPELVHTLNGSGLALARDRRRDPRDLPAPGRLDRGAGGPAAVSRARHDRLGLTGATAAPASRGRLRRPRPRRILDRRTARPLPSQRGCATMINVLIALTGLVVLIVSVVLGIIIPLGRATNPGRRDVDARARHAHPQGRRRRDPRRAHPRRRPVRPVRGGAGRERRRRDQLRLGPAGHARAGPAHRHPDRPARGDHRHPRPAAPVPGDRRRLVRVPDGQADRRHELPRRRPVRQRPLPAVGTDFASKVIDPAFNDFIKTVVPEYKVDAILGARDEIRAKAKDALAANLAQYHIIVDDIYIANIAFSNEFQAAIEAKQVAQQQVQTEQQILAQKRIQADQAVAQAQGQADSNVKLAEGQAAATIALANGQATANKSLAASLSDQILQYQYIQKLTDKIQVMLVPSGNATIFDLKGLLNQTIPTATPAPEPRWRRRARYHRRGEGGTHDHDTTATVSWENPEPRRAGARGRVRAARRAARRLHPGFADRRRGRRYVVAADRVRGRSVAGSTFEDNRVTSVNVGVGRSCSLILRRRRDPHRAACTSRSSGRAAARRSGCGRSACGSSAIVTAERSAGGRPGSACSACGSPRGLLHRLHLDLHRQAPARLAGPHRRHPRRQAALTGRPQGAQR